MSRKEQAHQTMWETWFVISVVLVIVMIFIGTLENSKTFFPNWIEFTAVAIINLVVCLIVGTHEPKE